MAIDKSLTPALLPEDPELEILDADTETVEDEPTIVELDDGGVEITLTDEPDEVASAPFESNLAEVLDDGTLSTIATDLMEEVDADIQSRKEWVDTFVEGLEVLGFKYERRTMPWEDACGVFSTVLAEAAIRFQAETMSETFPAAGPVKTKIVGEVTRDKEDAAERVRTDMNYELTEVMTEYRPEHERMLYSLGLAGAAFKKVYYDESYGRQVSIFLPAEDVIVPYGASHIETAERVTHIMRKTENEMARLQSSGFYVDTELGDPQSFQTDIEKKKAEQDGITINDDNRYTVYEIHAEIVIPGLPEAEDGLARPYIITVDKGTDTVLAVYRNWKETDVKLHKKKQYFVHYAYVPGFGFYGLGLIHIIGGYARAGTSIIRQLVDAGTLSNLPGGLKTRGLRIKGDDTPISPGEWRDADVPSGSLKENIVPLPYKEPSQTLLALLEQITTEGRRLGAISDMNISDMSAQAPVGTTLAILERTLKPMAAVQARVHYAMKQEFKLLKALIQQYAPEQYGYVPDRGEPRAKQTDYEFVEVIPVSDPNASTMAQRVVQYQAVFQMAEGAPQIYDLPYLHRQMIEILGVKNADKIIPLSEDAKPQDPVSENMAALVGKPMKAFIEQDHDAHISAHMAFLQDPMIAQAMGQSPMAQQMMTALQAHIAEHLGFSYRKQIEDTLGAPLPPPGQELPPEIEVQLARLVADAGKQLTMQHQQQAAQQQAQQQAGDPMFLLEQQKVQIQGAEVERKKEKDKMDNAIEKQRVDIEKAKVVATVKKDQATHKENIVKRKGESQHRKNEQEMKAVSTVIGAKKNSEKAKEKADKPKPKSGDKK